MDEKVYIVVNVVDEIVGAFSTRELAETYIAEADSQPEFYMIQEETINERLHHA